MKKFLTVILGAGASTSINSFSTKSLDNQDYRPPVTGDIFSDRSKFKAILRSYKLLETLTSDIERQLLKNKKPNLESILRKYQRKVKSNDLILRQFLQIPLYLNSLFGEISINFTTQPLEYNSLITNLNQRNLKVLYITLNYDTLLEIPLSQCFGIDFSKEDHYMQQNWIYAKIHGSTNWYKKIKLPPGGIYDFNNPPGLPKLDKAFVTLPFGQHNQRTYQGAHIYPAITVPVDTKYELNCPKTIIDRTKSFLKKCDNYLIIGTRCNDKDLLELLRKNAKKGKVLIVGNNEKETKDIKRKFVKTLPKFSSGTDIYFQERGFTDFIIDRLDSYIKELQ